MTEEEADDALATGVAGPRRLSDGEGAAASRADS